MSTQYFAARISNLPWSRREGVTAIIHTAQDRALPRASHWLDYDDSIGKYIGKLDLRHIWKATGSARNAFENLAPNIKLFLDGGVEPISSRVSWSIYMAGGVRSRSFVSPYIIFCCEVVEHRRDVRKMIIESGMLSRYPGLKNHDMSKLPDFDQLEDLADAEAAHHNHGDIMMLAYTF